MILETFQEQASKAGADEKHRIAIMQPYFFPYIGYWQLIHAVDVFVIYDDGMFIERGWIGRNRILGQDGKPKMICTDIIRASRNHPINELQRWVCLPRARHTIRNLYQVYHKAPHYAEAMSVIEPTILDEEPDLVRYLTKQLKAVAAYLGIDTEFHLSSEVSKEGLEHAEEKAFRICHHFGITNYVNPSGAGMQYYDKTRWKEAGGINLQFLRRNEDIRYQQFTDEFVPDLSIIDLMMFCSRDELHDILNRYHFL